MSLDAALFGERAEKYNVDVLDQNDTYLLTLPRDPKDAAQGITAGLTDGSVDFNLDGQIMGTGSLTIVDPDGLIDWMAYRFRPWVSVNGIRWNLGTFIPASPDDKYAGGHVTTSVTIGDKTTLLNRAKLTATLSVPAGATVTPWVEQMILDGAGESITGIVPSDKTLASALTWTPGTTYQKVCNDLLGSINYNPIWCDLDGSFRSEEWIDPQAQAPDLSFAEGFVSILSDQFEVTQDIVGVPNRVTCQTMGDDSNSGLLSVATNEDPSSQYSYQSRGGLWVDMFYDSVEASDQATLDAIARKNLVLNSTPPWYVDVSHAVVPLVGRQVLQFTSSGIDRQVSVNEWGVTMTPGSLMTGKWLAVSS